MRCALRIFLFVSLVHFSYPTEPSSPRPEEPVIETIFLPITIDERRRYSLNLTVSSGSQSQPLLFSLSTSTGYTSVAGRDCTSCDDGPGFDSSGITSVNQSAIFTLLENSWASGPMILGNCSIDERNKSNWAWNNQPILVANDSQGIFSSGISGLLGLGNNARNGDFDATPMGIWLKNNPGAVNFSFGLALNSPGDDSTNGGTLHWVKPDDNAMQGDVSFKDLHPNDSGSLDFDSFVLMDNWSFVSPTGVRLFKNDQVDNLITVIDPFFSSIYFPQNETRSIYAGIEGASRELNTSQAAVYSVPCDTQMNLTLTFGNVSVTLDESQLILAPFEDKCIGAIQEWADPSATLYLLGSLYIANIYLIYQGSSSFSGSYGFAHRKAAESSKSLSPVAITGVALGGAAFLMMVGVIIFLFLQHRKRKVNRNSSNTVFDPLLTHSSVSVGHSFSSRSPDLVPRPLAPPSTDWLPQGYLMTPTNPYARRETKAERNLRQVQASSPVLGRSRSPSGSRSRPSSAGQGRPTTILLPIAVSPSSSQSHISMTDLSPQYLLVPTTSRHSDGRLSPGWDIRSVNPQPSDLSSPPAYASQTDLLATSSDLYVDLSLNSHSRSRSENNLCPPPAGAMIVQPRPGYF